MISETLILGMLRLCIELGIAERKGRTMKYRYGEYYVPPKLMGYRMTWENNTLYLVPIYR